MAAKKVESGSSLLTWLETSIKVIEKYGIFKILEALCVILLTGYIVFISVNPEYIFKSYKAREEKEHSELIDKRLENSPRIQNVCDELLSKVDADRVMFLELHNNTGNISGLPFFYAKTSCESIGDEIAPVAEQYKDITLSLYPFSTYIFSKKYIECDVDDVKAIDKSFYYILMSSESTRMAMIVVDGLSGPNGIILITKKGDSSFSGDVRSEMTKASSKIGILIEGNK